MLELSTLDRVYFCSCLYMSPNATCGSAQYRFFGLFLSTILRWQRAA